VIHDQTGMGRTALSLAALGLLGLGFAPRAAAEEPDARNWQLFIDNYAIARATGFDRVVHHPRAEGIVIHNDRSWESDAVSPIYFARKSDGTFVGYYSAIWWAPNTDARSSTTNDMVYAEGVWRTRVPSGLPPDRDQQYVEGTAYATSTDGIHWNKPDLGLVDAPSGIDWKKAPPFPSPSGSSKNNNLGVPFRFIDLGQYGNVADPARRFAIYSDGTAYFARELPDFIHDRDWRSRLTPSGGTFSPRWKLLNFWDQEHDEWVAMVQNAVPHWLPAREIARFSSPDLKHWRSDIVLAADPEDSHGPTRYDEPMMLTPFYSEGTLFGLLSWFHGDRMTPDGGPVVDKDSPEARDGHEGWPWPTSAEHPYLRPFERKGVNEMRITVSRDGGINWDRTASREAWIPHGSEEDNYDRLVITSAPPVQVGDEDWFYIGVWNGSHLVTRADAAQSLSYHDRVRHGQIALYVQKHNRYVSLSTGTQTETLITRPLTIKGDTLQLNVDASRGRVRVGIAEYKPLVTLGKQLGQNAPTDGTLSVAPHLMERNMLPGFSLDDCEPILENRAEYTVRFKNGSSLRTIQGRKVVLFVEVSNADLYGFRVR
jgi:hypothetical protein